MAMTMELAHKGYVWDAYLLIYGGYLRKNHPLRRAILRAGWLPVEDHAPRLDAATLRRAEFLQTESYCQPPGTGLFGGSTATEGRRNIKRLREEVKLVLGCTLKRPRMQKLGELL